MAHRGCLRDGVAEEGCHRAPQTFLFIDMCQAGAYRDFCTGIFPSDPEDSMQESMSNWDAFQEKCLHVIDVESGKDLESAKLLLCPLRLFVPCWTLECNLTAQE